MACLKPIWIPNPSKRSGFRPSSPYYTPRFEEYDRCTGKADPFVTVPCRKCFGCLKDKQRSWRQRIVDEHSVPFEDRGVSCKYMLFVTFTVADEHMPYVSENPKEAFRKFFEKYRRVYGHSCRHFICSEHAPRTGRLHFHGVLFLGDAIAAFDRKIRTHGLRIRPLARELDKGADGRLTRTQRYAFSEELEALWPYGFVDVGYNCSGAAASYCSKYITKEFGRDLVLLVSQGFGRAWLNKNAKRLIAAGRRAAVHDGSIYGKSLCTYYRDKVFGGFSRESDMIEAYTSPLPTPEQAWLRDFRSTRFPTYDDWRTYVDSLDSSLFPSVNPWLTSWGFARHLDSLSNEFSL